jgi:hypothetical protein
MSGATTAVPDSVTIRNDIVVDRPVDAVWARVGGFCTIAHWLNVSCDLVSGNGDVGSVRRLNGVTLETMVSSTPHTYTYWQTAGNMAGYSYHGSLAAEPIGAGRTRLVYTLFYDAALMPSDAVRASERTRLNTRFVEPLNVMKKMAEGK